MPRRECLNAEVAEVSGDYIRMAERGQEPCAKQELGSGEVRHAQAEEVQDLLGQLLRPLRRQEAVDDHL